ncbi:MAG: hypothetical protein LBL25_00345 [Oscillospiraceae bacterium]|jgi:hypothetical protein|nr:hypothetical protein [Oscillospiraceae bacterium]
MTTGYFDRVWRARGARGLKNAFTALLRGDRGALIAAIADGENSFPVMYLLAPEIENAGLDGDLAEHVKHAMRLTAIKAGDSVRRGRYDRLLSPYGGVVEPTYDAVKWMIDTGADWDGPSAGRDSFDAAIDLAAAYLASRFPDGDALTKIAELIFRRNRRGLYIHDLVWGFFQTADERALSVIADYIKSENTADSCLACRLLGLDDAPRTRAERVAAHDEFVKWLTENRPYIYLTGEYFNLATSPHTISRDDEAKHLHREIDPETRAPLTPLTEQEEAELRAFRAQNGAEAV